MYYSTFTSQVKSDFFPSFFLYFALPTFSVKDGSASAWYKFQAPFSFVLLVLSLNIPIVQKNIPILLKALYLLPHKLNFQDISYLFPSVIHSHAFVKIKNNIHHLSLYEISSSCICRCLYSFCWSPTTAYLSFDANHPYSLYLWYDIRDTFAHSPADFKSSNFCFHYCSLL